MSGRVTGGGAPPRRWPRRSHALSITELLVALAILSSSIVPIGLFLAVGTESVKGTRDTAGAVFVANRTFEELRVIPYEELSTAAQRIATAPEIQVGPIAYRRTVTITPFTGTTTVRASLAWLKVEWARDRKKVLAYEVGTVLSDVR